MAELSQRIAALDGFKEREIVAEVVYSRLEINDAFGTSVEQWVVKMKPLDMDMSNSQTGVLHEWVSVSNAVRSKYQYFYEKIVDALPDTKGVDDYRTFEGRTLVFVQHKRTKAEGGRESENEMWVPVREASEEDIAQAKQRLGEKLGANVVQEVTAAKAEGISEEVREQIKVIAGGGEGGSPPTELKEQLRAIRQSELPQEVKQAVMENPDEYIGSTA